MIMRSPFTATLLSLLLPALLLLPATSLALSQDQQQALDIQNSMRAARGVPYLYWDDGLAWRAQEWANYLAAVGYLQHSDDGGENLYMQPWESGDALTAAAYAWVGEEGNYHGESIPDGDFSNYGHYTQCVWPSTQRVGMAAAGDGRGNLFVVAKYDPPGNYVGQRPY